MDLSTEKNHKLKSRLVGQSLTDRELQILTYAAQGQTTTQIGRSIFLEQNTIKSHLWRIGQKLQSNNTTHSVAIAIRSGWI